MTLVASHLLFAANASFWYVVVLVVPAVFVVLGIGYYLGKLRSRNERETTMKALLVMLQSTDRLTTDVDMRNTELADVGQSVMNLKATGELQSARKSLLIQIKTVIESNKKLETDLTCARYTLEEHAQELDRTRKEARTDSLSGVANRKSFDETLRYWMSRSQREDDIFSVVIADIDHFKWINDTHGHQSGDAVVSAIGKTVRESLRGEDFVGRYGGDEFAILLRGSSEASAKEIAERIRNAVSRLNFKSGKGGERIAVTLSMGLATVIEDDCEASILKRADQAMYLAKNAGRNCLRTFSEAKKRLDANAAVRKQTATPAAPVGDPAESTQNIGDSTSEVTGA